MSVSQKQTPPTRNLPRQSHSPTAGATPAAQEPDDIAAQSLAVLLDTVATADASFLPTLFQIVEHSPAWAPHLAVLREAADAYDETAGPARFRRAWACLQELEKLLAHPDRHPAQVIVCHEPQPLLHICAAHLERTADPEAKAALQAVHDALSHLAAVEERAARRRKGRSAAASPPTAASEEVCDAVG